MVYDWEAAKKKFDELYNKHGLPNRGYTGIGWYSIIENLIEELIALDWDKDLRQVKEKFGGLRFYIGVGTSEMREAIRRAENLSYKTCELCGANGNVNGDGYMRTLCKRCRSIK